MSSANKSTTRKASLPRSSVSSEASASITKNSSVLGRKLSDPGLLPTVQPCPITTLQPKCDPKPRSASSARSRSRALSNQRSTNSTPTKQINRLQTVESKAENRNQFTMLKGSSSFSTYEDDDELLAKSDQIYREAMAICEEIDNSDDKNVDELELGAEAGDHCREGNNSDNGYFTGSGAEVGITSVTPISSMISTSRTDDTTTASALKDGPEKPLEGKLGPAKSPSPEYDYEKVATLLKMIDEEESKGTEISSRIGEYVRANMTGSVSRNSDPDAAESHLQVESYSQTPPPPPSSSCSLPTRASPGTFEHEVEQYKLSKNDGTIENPPSSVASSILQIPSSIQSVSENIMNPNANSSPTGKKNVESTSTHSTVFSQMNSEYFHRSERKSASPLKAQTLMSFLDEVEESDRAKLFALKYNQDDFCPSGNSTRSVPPSTRISRSSTLPGDQSGQLAFPIGTVSNASTMDCLIRKGSVELAREVLMLERQLEQYTHQIQALEETLLGQRQLNVRNIKNAEKDLRKQLKVQQEEFELSLSRHQAFVDQLIVEKRSLQEKCEKILKESQKCEEKYSEQIKSIQEKHLEEIKRLRKLHENTEKARKAKWLGQKTQEIKDLTVKGLEPEVQRIIQRHQQEMNEMRAYYTDEIRELEERYARKQVHQIQEFRDKFSKEKDDNFSKEKEILQKQFEVELHEQAENFESVKKRLLQELDEAKERLEHEDVRTQGSIQEALRSLQIKHQVEIENLHDEQEKKSVLIEKRHEKELQTLKDNFESQREHWIIAFNKKNDQIFQDRESRLIEQFNLDKEKELREREKKLKNEYEQLRKEDEGSQELRIRRLQEKFQLELDDLEKSERELKTKFSSAKSELISKEEEIYSLRSVLAQREKENRDLSESNGKMLEERINLTSIIRREFTSQIEALEEDCRAVKGAVVELKTKHKIEIDSYKVKYEQMRNEKDHELEQIGQRVKQALDRKEETIEEMIKQLEKCQIRINHLEELLEQQRKDFVKSLPGQSSHHLNSSQAFSTSKRK